MPLSKRAVAFIAKLDKNQFNKLFDEWKLDIKQAEDKHSLLLRTITLKERELRDLKPAADADKIKALSEELKALNEDLHDFKTMATAVNGYVRVRNIFALHANEFEDQKANPDESDQAIVKRMYNQIGSLISFACSIHFNENYSKQGNQYISIKGKENEVTRLVTQEFAFYPSANRGPLSIECFNDLLEMVEKSITHYPTNLHLLLATFPVQDDNQNVFNIAVHVQCGPNAKITLVPKAISSHVDLSYPATGLSFFDQKNVRGEMHAKEINAVATHLRDIKYEWTFVEITKIIQLCTFHSGNYPPPVALMNELNLIKGKLKNINERVKEIDRITLAAHLDQFVKEILEKSSKLEKDVAQNFLTASLDIMNKPIAKLKKSLSRNIECTTGAGNKFVTAVDICLDHHYGVAKSAFQRRLSVAMNEAEMLEIPTVSHVVTSATINPVGKNSLSQHIELADSRKDLRGVYHVDGLQSIKDEKVLQNTLPNNNPSSAFGYLHSLDIFAPLEVGQLTGDLQAKIEFLNEVRRDYDELSVLRAKHVSQKALYDKLIMLHVLSTCVELMPANSSVSSILNKGITILNAPNHDQAALLKVLQTLVDHLNVIIKDSCSPLRDLSKLTKALLKLEQGAKLTYTNLAEIEDQPQILISARNLEEELFFALNDLDVSLPKVEKILRDGVDVNKRYSNQELPIHFAILNGDAELLEILLESKADLTALSLDKKSPMDLALDLLHGLTPECSRVEVVTVLLNAMKDSNLLTKKMELHALAVVERKTNEAIALFDKGIYDDGEKLYWRDMKKELLIRSPAMKSSANTEFGVFAKKEIELDKSLTPSVNSPSKHKKNSF